MTRRTVWFWVAIGYLIATVIYNLCNQGWAIYNFPTLEIGVSTNLGCKILAIGLLIYRRGEGVYLLAVAFLIGLSATIWQFHQTNEWSYLPILTKISRIDGFVISVAIILYMALLKRRGILKIGLSSS